MLYNHPISSSDEDKQYAECSRNIVILITSTSTFIRVGKTLKGITPTVNNMYKKITINYIVRRDSFKVKSYYFVNNSSQKGVAKRSNNVGSSKVGGLNPTLFDSLATALDESDLLLKNLRVKAFMSRK